LASGAVGAGSVPNGVQGFGRVQLDQVLQYCDNSSSPTNPTCPDNGFKKLFLEDERSFDPIVDPKTRYCFTTTSARPLKFTVAWSDKAGDPAASHALVNDIDIALMRLDTGALYRGNGGARYDHVNSIEQIWAPGAVGKWMLNVGGSRIVEKQPFAVVGTGDFQVSLCDDTWAQCPLYCSGTSAGTCQMGVCNCDSSNLLPRIGVDCSGSQCDPAQPCGLNGFCDNVLGGCACTPGFTGTQCDKNWGSSLRDVPDIMNQFGPQMQVMVGDYSINTFNGVVAALFFIGCCFAIICGTFGGSKFLEHRRDKGRR